jgi:hypothetical protein
MISLHAVLADPFCLQHWRKSHAAGEKSLAGE